MKDNNAEIWVFHGLGSKLTSGVFSDIVIAKEWISKYKLTGLLTAYPINKAVYDWSIEKGYFVAKNEIHYSPEFIQKFTTASQNHIHFENGEQENLS